MRGKGEGGDGGGVENARGGGWLAAGDLARADGEDGAGGGREERREQAVVQRFVKCQLIAVKVKEDAKDGPDEILVPAATGTREEGASTGHEVSTARDVVAGQ